MKKFLQFVKVEKLQIFERLREIFDLRVAETGLHFIVFFFLQISLN